jgi:LAO/AO transport system kinase
MSASEAEALVAMARAGNRRAAARIVTALEQGSGEAQPLLDVLAPAFGHALVVGVTGPPGAGKSTLVDACVRHLRQAGRTIGIIAVDPSSPVSGGAILGDRIRMAASLADDDVWMRSLASQGALGGLSPAAVRIIDAFDGLGRDIIVVETVGTGQNEIDVAAIADVRVVLAAPGLGDGIQAMKSGLLEIADILVVNQADRPGADETQRQLLAALSLRSTPGAVPVLRTVATRGDGLEALVAAIDVKGRRALATPGLERRRQRVRYLLERAVGELAEAALQQDGRAVAAGVDAILAGSASPATVARKLLQQASAAGDSSSH